MNDTTFDGLQPIFSHLLQSPAATDDLAQRLASRLGPGDLLALAGDLGAGKTHLARAVIHARLRAYGINEDVPSPSFTLVQTYQAGDLEIWHADLYRLSDISEVDELGLTDAFDDALCLIEWPDRLGPDLPDRALVIGLKMRKEPGVRDLNLSSRQPELWAPRLEGLL